MPLLAFLGLFAGCITVWSAGAPPRLVFLVALAAWIAFYVLLYPRLRSYKLAMGIDDQLTAAEAVGFDWLKLHLKGLKVMLFGFLTSMVPFLGSAAQWLGGQNLSFFFDPHNPATQQTVMFAIGAVAFSTPFFMSWLHIGALKEAAETKPKG